MGLWEPSKDRFEGGLGKLIDTIREAGMIPGLWLEIEFVGEGCPLKDKPDSWFFMRHGKRVVSNGRLILDFRNPETLEEETEIKGKGEAVLAAAAVYVGNTRLIDNIIIRPVY